MNPGGRPALPAAVPPVVPGDKKTQVYAPPTDYNDHYRNSDATPAQLDRDIKFLRNLKKFPEIEKAIKAYLTHRPRVEPWMYYELAGIIELNKGPTAEVKAAIGWAGELARRAGDVDSMIIACDMMILRKIGAIELAGKPSPIEIGPEILLDEAMRKSPDRFQPILLSILLATEKTDPKRLADGIERLFSLAWPQTDEAWRTDAQQKAEAVAKALREQGRDAEANDLLGRVKAASTRDLVVRLSWLGDAGLELAVDEPLGATATTSAPRTVFGGSITKSIYGSRANAGCEYSCPRGFSGDYTIRVETIYRGDEVADGNKVAQKAAKPVTQAIVEITTHEGLPDERRVTKTVSIPRSTPIVVSLTGGRRTTVLPFIANARPTPKDVAAPADAPKAAPPKP